MPASCAARRAIREVERILVHPGIKKKLCDTVTGDRSWLGKVRPFWGHDSHFHIRIGCPAGSPGCRPQEPIGRGDGCDSSLAWWFTDEPWRPATGPQQPRARDVMRMADLPRECRGRAAGARARIRSDGDHRRPRAARSPRPARRRSPRTPTRRRRRRAITACPSRAPSLDLARAACDLQIAL